MMPYQLGVLEGRADRLKAAGSPRGIIRAGVAGGCERCEGPWRGPRGFLLVVGGTGDLVARVEGGHLMG